MTAPGGPTRAEGLEGPSIDTGRTLAELAREVWEGRWKVLSLSLAGGLVALVITFIVPPTFEAVTTAIPVNPMSRASGAEALALRAQELGIGGGPQPQTSATYPDIVRSRRLLEETLQMSFPTGRDHETVRLIDLVQPRGREPKRTENALRELRRQVHAVVDRRTGLFTLTVRSSRATVAAGVANTLRTLLQEYAITSMTTQAGENRKFIEGRLLDTRTELAGAEEALRAFREDNLRIGNSPRLLLQQGRLVREVRTQEEIFLALTREHELAKVAEHRDVPVIAILDSAAVPAFRSAPQRAVSTVVGLALGALLGAVIVTSRRNANGRIG